MKLVLFPYKMGSSSAKNLAQSLNIKRVRANGRYVPKRKHVIINWGNSKLPNWYGVIGRKNIQVLNKPNRVEVASNKLETFKVLSRVGVKIPVFTTLKTSAIEMLENGKVMCRTILNGHSGKGIVVAKEVADLVDAPLYTQYIKKENEFRVHIFQDKVIDYVQKKKKAGFEDRNKYVRSTANGWVFCREDIDVREDVKTIAVNAVNALGLDFGAVDVVLGKDGLCYVLEVNTAIGMEGTTVERYTEAFQEFLNDL